MQLSQPEETYQVPPLGQLQLAHLAIIKAFDTFSNPDTWATVEFIRHNLEVNKLIYDGVTTTWAELDLDGIVCIMSPRDDLKRVFSRMVGLGLLDKRISEKKTSGVLYRLSHAGQKWAKKVTHWSPRDFDLEGPIRDYS